MAAQEIKLDIASIPALNPGDVFGLGSTIGKNLFIQFTTEDLSAEDSTWELHQSAVKNNINSVLIAGGDFTLTAATVTIDLTNLSGLFLSLKLISLGTVADGILTVRGTVKD